MTSTGSGAESELKWQPPLKIEELFASTAGNKFASINRPTAGAREEQDVPVGDAPFQLYSLGTPNGQKPGILLEELGIDYDAHSKKLTFLRKDHFFQKFAWMDLNLLLVLLTLIQIQRFLLLLTKMVPMVKQ
jgi:hypothetical protein